MALPRNIVPVEIKKYPVTIPINNTKTDAIVILLRLLMDFFGCAGLDTNILLFIGVYFFPSQIGHVIFTFVTLAG